MRYVSRVALFALLFVALLTWALERSFSFHEGYGARADAVIDTLKLADSRLLKDVLLTRAGLLQNYDPLVADINDLRDRSQELAATAGPWSKEIEAVRDVAAHKEDALERFKSENALLQNSLAYFDTVSGRIAESDIDASSKIVVAGLAGAITHLLRDSSEDNIKSIVPRLDALSRTPFGSLADANRLRKHAELIVDAIPTTNELLLALQDDAISVATKRIRDDVQLQRAVANRSRLMIDAGLYAGACLFFLLLMRTLALLHRDSETLRWTALKERLASETSNLFIACPPEQVDERMEEMVRCLGEGYGHLRCYMLMLDGSRRTFKWEAKAAIPGWPEALFDFAEELAGLPVEAVRLPYDDVALSSALRAALAERDVELWAFVKVRLFDEVIALLAADRDVTIPPGARTNHDNLLLHANVVHNALLRLSMSRKRTELETKLRKAERLEAVGTFTTGVAHNFNNLVGAIAGQAEMTLDLLPPEHRAADHVRRLLHTTARAQQVASQILDFGRIGGGIRTEVAVGPLIAETVAVLGTSTGHPAVGVEVEGAEVTRYTWADAGRLQQVFHNVILNAIQASSGAVRVTVDECTTGEKTTAGDGHLTAGSYIRVVVADRGAGIDAATLARMFEPFFTTRPTGTGLGLATVLGTLNELDGGIDVESRVGEGTTMTLWLPAAKTPPEQPDLAGRTVMIVNPDAEGVLRDEEVLASLGFEPVGFVDPDDALAALWDDEARFDLVIIEKQTSCKSMQAFVGRVRASLKAGPRIVLSGSFSSLEARDFEKLDTHAIVARPWSPSLLLSTVHDALRAAEKAEQKPVELLAGSPRERELADHRAI